MFGIPYWIIPVFAGCVWLGGLLAMLCTWIAKGEPYYEFMHATSQHIVYISDIGATSWGKPIFIATSAVMVVSFDLVFMSERWLRHKRRLTPNYSRWEKAMSILSIFWSIVGAAGLILLTIFDTAHHKTAHDSLLGVFIAGYVISAICVCIEYLLLGLVARRRDHGRGLQTHRQHRILLASFAIKAVFIIVEIALAVAFGALEYTERYNQSAILEWVVALVYIFYVWSYVFDFLPVNFAMHRTRSNRFQGHKNGSEEMAMANDGSPAFA
ncbi:hypothetical protein M406DRAFT_354075 [Cryphonectria parasitica EP155]|uniref:CWH43-like N-terminal domain-containing protein n=1 Tax=Cryphonectria parasitica (strain ATCC 38755 / EP155) TaxID=660469 RepID=A0A9P4YB18_CRYP1|nr:uncharacterized protein M406DRAFT_354075 [Cryphonectria parasitica EP155]KAF3769617.1 hypothetical protein M406DRAFT_354075 [Cryphonectria parasitica EP155]